MESVRTLKRLSSHKMNMTFNKDLSNLEQTPSNLKTPPERHLGDSLKPKMEISKVSQ